MVGFDAVDIAAIEVVDWSRKAAAGCMMTVYFVELVVGFVVAGYAEVADMAGHGKAEYTEQGVNL